MSDQLTGQASTDSGSAEDGAFERRTRACQRSLADADADAVVLFPSSNLYYLSGFSDEPMERHLLLFVAEDNVAFVVPDLYAEEVRDDSWVTDIRSWADGEDPLEHVAAIANEFELQDGHLLVDDSMWARFTQDLRAAIPEATWGLGSEVLGALRMRKDEVEVAALREAGRRSDAVCETIRELGEDAIGLTERELARDIEERLIVEGCSGTSFDVIVGSGPYGSKPHHRHGDRTIERGDPVVLDFGGVYDHYPGDQTRTVVFAGDPPAGFEERYRAVREANEASVQAVTPGTEAQAIDRAARAVIEEAGYGDEFVHRTGHGVGLDVHEPPYIVEGNDLELEPGMVFSIEPGVYPEGEYGVRIEDLVVVTEDSCERLNDSARTWKPL
ncbi:M24 family metallopeptidase [Halegenticoccus tardaugens]|uniref:M24 family metallopeptidase n=1 Tax=Halegenticoccus tardaugens TaxID=2071624 RepID=UPI00100B3A2B|nr:Xaa-Pro peptidase family protein [Halegenticoccus tardaugens]